MHPTYPDISVPRRQHSTASMDSSTQQAGNTQVQSTSPSVLLSESITRLRSEESSWVEVSSQPSSSSLSSLDDAQVPSIQLRRPTLTAQHQNMHPPRRLRQLRRSISGPARPDAASLALTRSPSVTGSSQEEYEESESESGSDRILTSWNEDIGLPEPLQVRDHQIETQSSSPERVGDQDEQGELSDDGHTALGLLPEIEGSRRQLQSESVFTPRPNVFSHPPSSTVREGPSFDIYFSLPAPNQTRPRPARRRSHTPFNTISPHHTIAIDHDAALRASLSTLLSCAAAARGLPKRDGIESSTALRTPQVGSNNGNRVDTSTIRLFSARELQNHQTQTPSPLPPPTQRSKSPDLSDLKKRRSKSTSTSQESKRRKRRSSSASSSLTLPIEDAVSPTLLTWMVGAGVVVLVSAIGFSAGYALGKEAGRLEGVDLDALPFDERGFGGMGGMGRGRWRWGVGRTSAVAV